MISVMEILKMLMGGEGQRCLDDRVHLLYVCCNKTSISDGIKHGGQKLRSSSVTLYQNLIHLITYVNNNL